jgi:hypothetical protein
MEPVADFEIFGTDPRKPSSLLAVSIEELMNHELWQYHRMDAAEIRYVKNKILATYGYPFKNALMRSQFYYAGSPFQEDPPFTKNKMTPAHREFALELADLERRARGER